MPLKLKMFDTLGMVTLVTPPSMMNGEDVSFTLINLKEKEKNHFAIQLNKIFPKDNVVVYLYDGVGEKGWLFQAINKCKFVVMDRRNVPIWAEEMVPDKKKYFIDAEQTVEQVFENIQKENK